MDERLIGGIYMLTTRQKCFADAYLLGGDPCEAYRAAGYKEKNVTAATKRLLGAPAVQEYLQERTAAGRERQVADATEVLQFLTSVLRGENGSDRERLRAAELLGKRHGLFNEKLTADTAAVIIVDDLGG